MPVCPLAEVEARALTGRPAVCTCAGGAEHEAMVGAAVMDADVRLVSWTVAGVALAAVLVWRGRCGGVGR